VVLHQTKPFISLERSDVVLWRTSGPLIWFAV